MSLFQVPPPTRFDLRFTVAGVPVRVHPLFWLIAILFGSSSSNLLNIITWVAAIFLSILIHELGHAFALRRYGQRSQIVLHLAGGLTIPESMAWDSGVANVAVTANQQIFISLAGPFAGFLLAGLVLAAILATGGNVLLNHVFGFIPFPDVSFPGGSEFLNSIVISLLWVNLFWGFINLMPVYPLDGGTVARYILIQTDPWNGIRKSLWISVVAGIILAAGGLLLLRSTYMAVLFGLLAFQSFQALQGSSVGRY